MKREAQAQILNMIQTWQSVLNLVKFKKEKWEIKTWKKEGRKWQWLRKGLKPMTSQMACHALTNWTTEFECLRLSRQHPAEADNKVACSMGRVQRAESLRRRLNF